MTLSAFLSWRCRGPFSAFPLSASDSAQPADSLDTRPIHSIEIYSDNQWASNAATKWVVAGLAFGGDITSPVRTLIVPDRRAGNGRGWRPDPAGRRARPAADEHRGGAGQGPMADHGRPGASAARIGNLVARDGHLLLRSARHRGQHGRAAGHVDFPALGLHVPQGGGHSDPSDGAAVHAGGHDLELECQRGRSPPPRGRFPSIQQPLPMGWGFASIGPEGVGHQLHRGGNPLQLGLGHRHRGGGRRGRTARPLVLLGPGLGFGPFRRLDLAAPRHLLCGSRSACVEGAGLDFSDVIQNDTIASTLRRRMPSTVQFQWDRESLRMPGVVWSLRLENNRSAPRGQAELVRSSGRCAVRTTVGIGYGGWGGTYIPLDLEFASRDVRQGRPGGTLAVSTRWLALPGSGGRMALGLNWHQTF